MGDEFCLFMKWKNPIATAGKKTQRQLEQPDQVPDTKVREKCKTHARSQTIHLL